MKITHILRFVEGRFSLIFCVLRSKLFFVFCYSIYFKSMGSNYFYPVINYILNNFYKYVHKNSIFFLRIKRSRSLLK
jgi:hypothetical protein